jgi:predicted nucleic acid-binding protein
MTDKMKKKKIAFMGIFVIGLMGIIVSACWDYLLSKSEPVFGNYQIAGLVIGMIIAFAGIALFAMKPKERK